MWEGVKLFRDQAKAIEDVMVNLRVRAMRESGNWKAITENRVGWKEVCESKTLEQERGNLQSRERTQTFF